MAHRPIPGKEFKSSSLAKSSNTAVLGRTTAYASLQQQANRQQAHLAVSDQPPKFPKLKAFLSSYVWPWIKSYLRNVFRKKYGPYPNYLNSPGDNGVYTLRPSECGQPIRLAIAGDWGTGTFESYEIGCAMTALNPDYTIHLGDVYYVGDPPEVDENFLGKKIGIYTPIKWPCGKIGEFALIGNHEMYAGGEPYFTTMITELRTGTGTHQKTSYFALETDHWRIIALDTGYNSVGLPILGAIPWIKNLSFVGANCRLEDGLINWLRTTVNPRANRKPTLILSHHQYFTAFKEEISAVPAKQLAEFFSDQEVIWIWAHEHRLAVYGKYAPNGVAAYGRCLGNGGMPCETTGPVDNTIPIAYRDPRVNYPLDDNSCAGWNGFLDLSLNGPTMNLRYVDVQNNLLFTESFTGHVDGSIDPPIQTHGPAPAPYRPPDHRSSRPSTHIRDKPLCPRKLVG